ncbi:nuclear transport factor 2 family protein [Phenylobacterium sp. LjRoot219]|uniref:nuclear transport factor 2 family protein n=1 Tax=Phenylobacterium sp. LjRoot219 TaxID=3342283 RepID=UPI003ECEA9C0
MDQSRLQTMLDHFEITQTIAEYCHGCDRSDEAHMGSAYLEDSWDDHGHIKAPGREFARLMTIDIQAQSTSLSHQLGQSLVRVDGDEAGAETYFIAVSRSLDADGRELCNQLGGRYVDRLVREDGRWLVKHRIAVRDWSISLPIEQDWLAEAGMKPGLRSNDDPSYAALQRVHGSGHLKPA